jgi:hypothetical protein
VGIHPSFLQVTFCFPSSFSFISPDQQHTAAVAATSSTVASNSLCCDADPTIPNSNNKIYTSYAEETEKKMEGEKKKRKNTKDHAVSTYLIYLLKLFSTRLLWS